MFYVYILQNQKTKKFYTGFTEDLKSRLESHTSKTVKTTQNGTYQLVFSCALQTKQKALVFERYLKHGSGHAFARKHFIAT
jgi:putative endonuclease